MRTASSTDDILMILENSKDLCADWSCISDDMDAPLFHEYLSQLLSERDIDASKLCVTALLSRSFAYQMCSGVRVPGRDIIIRISAAIGLSLDETQRLLKLANRGVLYPRVKRDAVIIYSLSNSLSLYETDGLLTKLGQTPLL